VCSVLAPVPVLPIRTGQKFPASCYATSGFMWQNLKFGEVAGQAGCSAAWRRDDSTGIVILRPEPLAGRRTSLSFRIPPTRHSSRATAFLIDTLAIRITPKSFDCIANVHSNRHSPATLTLRRKSQYQRKSRPHFDRFSSCSAGLQPSTSSPLPLGLGRCLPGSRTVMYAANQSVFLAAFGTMRASIAPVQYEARN
jgi:hypothetical protein